MESGKRGSRDFSASRAAKDRVAELTQSTKDEEIKEEALIAPTRAAR